jgi:AraC family transcriptional regulator, transcriptional activator of pobA
MASETIPIHQLIPPEWVSVRVDRLTPEGHSEPLEVHRHDHYELFFLRSGEGNHMIDLEHYTLHTPSIHVVAPGQVHRLERSHDAVGSVLLFTREATLDPRLQQDVEQVIGHPGSPTVLPIASTQLDDVERLLELIEATNRTQEGPGQRIAAGLLGVVLAHCAHWFTVRDEAPRGISDPVQRFLADVERLYLDERSVTSYAERLSISPGHLNVLVQKRLGKNSSAVIQDRLLLEAKRLLLHADLSVKEISYALRMEDPAYFNRVFKKATGSTPLDYRTAIREKYHR